MYTHLRARKMCVSEASLLLVGHPLGISGSDLSAQFQQRLCTQSTGEEVGMTPETKHAATKNPQAKDRWLLFFFESHGPGNSTP